MTDDDNDSGERLDDDPASEAPTKGASRGAAIGKAPAAAFDAPVATGEAQVATDQPDEQLTDDEQMWVKRAEQFALARLEELCSDDSPWWMRSDGVGLRLRLHELLDAAESHQAGGVRERALAEMRQNAMNALKDPYGYPARHFDKLVKRVGDTLKIDKLDGFIKGGKGPSAVEAFLMLLDADDIDYMNALACDVGSDARAARGMDDLRRIAGTVDLFDAELSFVGHSRQWRRQFVHAARELVDNGETLSDAVTKALEQCGFAKVPTKFDVLFPLVDSEDNEAFGQASYLDKLRAIEYLTELGAAVHLSDDPKDSFVYKGIEAADHWAAVDIAADQFQVDSGHLRLRGQQIRWMDVAIVVPTGGGESKRIELPLHRTNVLPPGVDAYLTAGVTKPRIDDALSQLAQARTGSHAAALADIWIAAEMTFGGAGSDPRHEVATVMSSLGGYLYVSDVLDWLVKRFVDCGVTPGEEQGQDRNWVLESLGDECTAQKLLDSGDLMAWWRFSRVVSWSAKSDGFATEVRAVEHRMKAIADRAYLIRNFVVHQGNVPPQATRRIAIAVTLPPFAELVRSCLGYAAKHAASDVEPLAAALHASFRSDQFKQALKDGAESLPDAVETLLVAPLAISRRARPPAQRAIAST